MKLLGPLCLLLAIAFSVGSLRGEKSNAASRRRLDNVYLEYEGVCRKNSNGTGGGSNGVDYEKTTRADNSAVNFQWCKNECETDSDCTGFEYRDTGDTSQCEVWTTPIRGFERKNDHVCHVVVEQAHHYWCEYYNACRRYADGSGKGDNGDEYDLTYDVSYYWCKEQCSHNDECKAFEYRYGWGGREQCEIWTTEALGLEDGKPGLECCTKIYE